MQELGLASVQAKSMIKARRETSLEKWFFLDSTRDVCIRKVCKAGGVTKTYLLIAL